MGPRQLTSRETYSRLNRAAQNNSTVHLAEVFRVVPMGRVVDMMRTVDIVRGVDMAHGVDIVHVVSMVHAADLVLTVDMDQVVDIIHGVAKTTRQVDMCHHSLWIKRESETKGIEDG